MSDPTLQQLLSSCQIALDVAQRNIRIARALAEGCRSSLSPPDDVLDAYLASVDHDDEEMARLRQRLATLAKR